MRTSYLFLAVAVLASATDLALGQNMRWDQPSSIDSTPPYAPLWESERRTEAVPASYAKGSTHAKCATSDCDTDWFASFGLLYMGRNNPNRLWTTYESGNNPNQLTNTQDANAHWRGGIEVGLGRVICDSCWSWEANYWTLDTMRGYESQTHPSTVSTPLDVASIEFAGVNGTVLFDNAAEHRLWRSNDVHSFEFNFVRSYLTRDCDGGFSLNGLAGFRYFRFEEDLTFGSLADGGTWGGNGGLDEAYLEEDIENDLFGFQVGFDAQWHTGNRLSFFFAPKFGIYNNHISHRFSAYRGDGTDATPTVASGMTGSYPVESSKDVVSFMAEVDLGIGYDITPRCTLELGYRVVALTGIGLADNQIPHYVVDIPEIADIDANGDLVLHGATLSLTYRF
jgi:hypothetical protein